HHHRTRIHFAQETPGARVILGDDAVGVLRAVLRNVVDGLIDAIDDADRQDRRQIFGRPVFLGSGFGGVYNGARPATTAQFDALLGLGYGQTRQHFCCDILGDQQRFHRVAGAVALAFSVERDLEGFLKIGPVVDIDVADAVEVFDDRHFRFARDTFDQPLATARHDDVDVLRHRDQFSNRSAIGGFDDLHGGFRQARRTQTFAQAGGDGLVRGSGFGDAARNRGVAGLDAEAGGVDGHIVARFVNDADHTVPHADAANLDAGWTIVEVGEGDDRFGQRG